MPGSVAETVYGRQGGGWVERDRRVALGDRRDVPCAGGPMAGSTLVTFTYGQDEPLPDPVPYPCGGRYVLDESGRYVWEPAT